MALHRKRRTTHQTPEQQAEYNEAIKRVEAGENVKDVAASIGRSFRTVYRWLEKEERKRGIRPIIDEMTLMTSRAEKIDSKDIIEVIKEDNIDATMSINVSAQEILQQEAKKLAHVTALGLFDRGKKGLELLDITLSHIEKALTKAGDFIDNPRVTKTAAYQGEIFAKEIPASMTEIMGVAKSLKTLAETLSSITHLYYGKLDMQNATAPKKEPAPNNNNHLHLHSYGSSKSSSLGKTKAIETTAEPVEEKRNALMDDHQVDILDEI